MIVMDDSTCAVDIALRTARFFVHESCGECTPCRVGTSRMLQLLTRIRAGYGSWHDLQTLEELTSQMSTGSRCGLGQAAVLPFLSSLRYFRTEYQAHIEDKICPNGICPISSPTVKHSVQEGIA